MVRGVVVVITVVSGEVLLVEMEVLQMVAYIGDAKPTTFLCFYQFSFEIRLAYISSFLFLPNSDFISGAVCTMYNRSFYRCSWRHALNRFRVSEERDVEGSM